MEDKLYNYSSILRKVIDADTLELEVDVGFNMKYTGRFRLLNYEAPEVRHSFKNIKRGWTREDGIKAKKFLSDLLPKETILYIKTHKSDSFGRYLVDAYIESSLAPEKNIVEILILNGHGVRL